MTAPDSMWATPVPFDRNKRMAAMAHSGDAVGMQIDDRRWLAVQTRDHSHRTAFVYAVRSTGIYCRPGCPSRLARRENILFFDRWDAAEGAGFRACRRCLPKGDSPEQSQGRRLDQIRALLERDGARPTLAELAALSGMSKFHLQRLFKKQFGLTPLQFVKQRRLAAVREQLHQGSCVTDAIYSAGFESGSRFYENAQSNLGMKPSVYRKGGAGLAIGFATVPCSLGFVLVAATERGVCSVRLGDSAAAILEELRAEFPAAAIQPASPAMLVWTEAIVAQIDNPQSMARVPLDARGTAFQFRVWQALTDTKPGERLTYTGLAERLGMPQGARAVARACASNPLAVLVPCHRVVEKEGGLAGYRWGLERKKALLDRELLFRARQSNEQ